MFLQKQGPRDKKTPTSGEHFERSSQLFLLIDVEILEFCRNQTLRRTGRLSNYSLVIPSSFSLTLVYIGEGGEGRAKYELALGID